MDPQQRIALETAHAAMTQACLATTVSGGERVGVFVGECNHDFEVMHGKGSSGPYKASGGASSISANRISHVF
eukprot:214754-Rhodomonas_salina.1